ncbi:MAG: endonuclease/exonuclease/phosphatase family protein [Bacteroidales bacterium]
MAIKILKQGINTILVILSILLAIVTIISAFSGLINPLINAKFALLGMVYPVLIILVIVSLISLLIIKRWRIALIPLLTLTVTSNTSAVYFPFNISSTDKVSSDSTFTLLTYNVMNFVDYQLKDKEKSKDENRTAQYIIDVDADIVALQECTAAFFKDKSKNIPKKLLAKLKDKYPYREFTKPDIAFLSKYPIKNKTIKLPTLDNGSGCGGAIIKLPTGDIELINVHLQSNKLQKEDKALYKEVTSLEGRDNREEALGQVRTQLIGKLTTAFRSRAEQAEELRNHIENIDSPNLIVCGDFNDTPASYVYRTIKGDNMSDAYTQCAFFPTITYHADRFYFRIDQVFYRGNIQATSIKRGNLKSSDHYPLLTSFQLK